VVVFFGLKYIIIIGLYIATIYIYSMDSQKLLSKVIGFDWDEHNVLKNWEKHSISNWECEEIFFNEPLVIRSDLEHSETEERHFALGNTDEKTELFVVFTIRKNLIRPISFRHMAKSEKRIYEVYKKK
jgi:uncharacterized protein